MKIDSGPVMRIGKVSYEGLERYDESVLTPLQQFKTGDVYKLQGLLDFQTRLRSTLWFRSVTVLPDLAGMEEHPERQ